MYVTPIAEPQRAAEPKAWYTVGLLAALFVFSFIDRLILALLAEPISRDLSLTDLEMSVLIGLGFALLYSAAGLPLAHLIDTRRRRNLVAFGVVLWSASTIASAFATDFSTLLTCRAGVAIGEAVLSPAAVSMIGDLFPKQRRAAPMAAYSAVSGVMGTGSFIVGAAALDFATQISSSVGLAPWRLTLIMVGAPALLLGLIFALTVPEPRRLGSEGRESASLPAFAGYFGRAKSFYAPLLFGTAVLCCFTYGMSAWLPTILVRSYGFSTASAGYAYGLVGVPAALLATAFWPFVAAWFEKRSPGTGLPLAFLALSAPVVPLLVVTPLIRDASWFLVLLWVVIFCGAGLAILPQLVFQTYAPGRFRARFAALNLLGINILGLALGPVAIVWLGSLWEDASAPLSAGLSTLGVIVGPVAVLCFAIAWRRASLLEDDVA